MLEFIALAASGASAVVGFLQSRGFVRNRLRFVSAIQSTAAPILAGVGAAAVALPVVGLLPVVGAGTAAVFGVGVGAGVAAGARDLRRRLTSGD